VAENQAPSSLEVVQAVENQVAVQAAASLEAVQAAAAVRVDENYFGWNDSC